MNDHGANGESKKPRAISMKVEQNGTISIEYAPLLRRLGVLFLGFVMIELGRIYLQLRDHEVIGDLKASLREHVQQEQVEHEGFVKVTELDWRIGNTILGDARVRQMILDSLGKDWSNR